jgi:hypothetical protein
LKFLLAATPGNTQCMQDQAITEGENFRREEDFVGIRYALVFFYTPGLMPNNPFAIFAG